MLGELVVITFLVVSFPPPLNPTRSAIVGGFFGGEVLDGKGVEAISKLPTKQELMQQTAIALKMVPTKLARSLKQAGAERLAKGLKQASAQKMVVAVKLASDKMPN